MAGRRSIEEGFHHRVVDGGGEWMAGVEEGSGWWFSLDLGVEIDGATVPLLVFVYKLLAQGTVEERMLESQQRKKRSQQGSTKRAAMPPQHSPPPISSACSRRSAEAGSALFGQSGCSRALLLQPW